VTAPVVPLRPADDIGAAAHEALGVVSRHLDRCKLSARTVRAYKRQAAAYAGWLAANASAHGDAFADLIGAEGAVTAWKRDMLTARSSPATVNQALAAVTLMYEQAGLRISVKRVRIPRPGEPDALTRPQEAALRRSAARRGPRDAALIASPRSCSPPATTPASPGLRPHRARHTFATRLRQGGADPAQVQALLGHASIDTAARYFRSGAAENAEVIERVFSD
jgi:hypothetical protein